MSEKILYEFTHIHQPTLFADQELADDLAKKLDRLEVIFISARKEAQLISDRKDLTKQGRINQLRDLSAKVDRETKQWYANTHYAEMIKQIEEETEPKQNRLDEVVGELRKCEFRNYLRSLDPIAQEHAYWEAAVDGIDLLLSAIEESPIPFDFVTPTLIDKSRIILLDTQYSEQIVRFDDLQIACQQVDSALNSVRATLRKSGVEIAGQDPVAAAAAA